MMSNQARTRKVLIDINLLMDIESLNHTIVKTYVLGMTGKTIPISDIVSLRNKNFKDGTTKLIENAVSLPTRDIENALISITDEFNKYKSTIKPKLNALFFVKQLISSGTNVILYSFYEKEVNSFIENDLITKHFPKVQFISISKVSDLLDEYSHMDLSVILITNGLLSDLFSKPNFSNKSKLMAIIIN